MRFIALGGLGLIVGVVLGVITRPSIPLFGRPPIDVSFSILFDARDGMDRMYQSAFGEHLALYGGAGLVIGLAVGVAANMMTKRRS